MNSKRLKLIVLGIFAFVAISVFFASGTRSGAQKDPKSILELAAGYKTWQRPVKPLKVQNRPLEPLSISVSPAGVVAVDSSSEFG